MIDKILTNSKDVDLTRATKSLKAYLELKRKHQDKILLYRIGDFYETFFEDAVSFSKVCDIALTSKKYGGIGKVALAGIPHRTLAIYVKRLIENNCKVALAEQFQDGEGNFYRKIVRIYTAATVYENEFLESDSNNYLAAIFKSTDLYGFSYCDVSEGSFYVTYGKKEEIEREIIKIAPKEILLNLQEIIFDFNGIIKDLNSICICPDYFNEKYVQLPKGEYRCGYLCANAIISYLLETQREFAPKLDEIKRYSISNFLSMDFLTRRGLELTRTQSDFKKHGSLFWFLDSTKTPMGRRLLREWMNAPLNNLDAILKRKKVISEFCLKPNLRSKTNEFLNDFCDLLRYSAKISNRTVSYKELVEISRVLSKSLKVDEIISELNFGDLEIDSKCVQILNDFSNIIIQTFDDEENCSNYQYFPIKQGVNPRLDILRKELEQLNNDLLILENKQKNDVSKDAKVKHVPSVGYCYEVPISNFDKISSEYIVKQRLASVVRYCDAKLIELEEKIYSQKYSIGNIEKNIFENLQTYCMELTEKIRSFARVSAYLDVVNSISNMVIDNKFCEVNFNTKGIFELTEVMHPCVYKVKGNFVTNSVNLDNDRCLCVLTGANMSGKSTYLKQNAIAVILSQMCGFTCAKNANMYLFDKIFFHSCVFDNLKDGESTFYAEMKNIAYIVNNSTQKSLILLDEPVKGTQKDDSEALLFAILDNMELKIRAKTIVATHFISITTKKTGKREIVLIDSKTKKIQKGICKASEAFDVALDAGMDKSIIENAKKYTIGQF